MYYAMRASAPSLHRESTDSLIYSRNKTLIQTVIDIESSLIIEVAIASAHCMLTS